MCLKVDKSLQLWFYSFLLLLDISIKSDSNDVLFNKHGYTQSNFSVRSYGRNFSVTRYVNQLFIEGRLPGFRHCKYIKTRKPSIEAGIWRNAISYTT